MDNDRFDSLLVEMANKAAESAYAPYSNFRVGASVLCEDHSIVTGFNIENVSYGLTCCAERTALFSVLTSGKKPVKIAVTCIDAPEGSKPTPCGACRQVIAELMPANAEVIVVGGKTYTVSDLLPDGFTMS